MFTTILEIIFKKPGSFTGRQKLTYNNFFCVICQVVSWILGCTAVVMILTARFSAMALPGAYECHFAALISSW